MNTITNPHAVSRLAKQRERLLAMAVAESVHATTPAARRPVRRTKKHNLLLDVLGFAVVVALAAGYLTAAIN